MIDTGSPSSISEFERTKPVETMRSLNALIKKIDGFLNNGRDPNIHLAYGLLEESLTSLKDIKDKLKNGE